MSAQMTAITANQITRRHSHRATSGLQLAVDDNLGDFVFFKLVNDYFSNEIQAFGLELMSRAMRWVRRPACLSGLSGWSQFPTLVPRLPTSRVLH
ncbi:hypothetical protein XvhCFBP2543_07455 [Xanthomonas vasicola]|nr:hypothetical protein NX04_15250 [Xanthomonas vasicola]KNX93778.1 hypothetical protein NX05_23045 [Xanthomonas vasicola]PPV03109.1 hypothetical protein XvhCFBP2543_07455 [Xanthomonas vasicola]TWR19060.1 hypothetical protein FQJ95_22830 [Xanthomonas vasicola]